MQHAITSVLLICSLLTLPLVSGCSGTHKTIRETTTVTSNSEAAPAATTTTTTHTQTSASTEVPAPRQQGLLGGIFGFIGAVLAFPFKLIGGIIEAIF